LPGDAFRAGTGRYDGEVPLHAEFSFRVFPAAVIAADVIADLVTIFKLVTA
jgi:hypothetical protein